MSEKNLCMSCVGACCKGPTTISLTDEERVMMESAGTRLKVIAEPADHDRDDVLYPVGWSINPERRTMQMIVERGRETEPLAAGLGRYTMFGSCGNLVEVDGVEQCGAYDDRPQVCRDFEMGGEKCDLFRMRAGLK